MGSSTTAATLRRVTSRKAKRAFSVALIGPDGAGKSASSERLGGILPLPLKRIYMGINPDASDTLLPTTRLIFAIKRAQAGKADTDAEAGDPSPSPAGLLHRTAAGLRSGARLVAWVSEEWFRQGVAAYHMRRGRIVVFDRHFFVDYYRHDAAGATARPLGARLHEFLLRRAYPKPDLTICLDAPSEVLSARKQEAPPEWLERRRREYLAMARVLPHFVIVDAGQPLEDVTRDVATAIVDFHERASGNQNGGL
jgi:Thymidylate kinase